MGSQAAQSHQCPVCGQAMGAYEPLILIGEDRRGVRTSRLAHGEGGGVLIHEECWRREGHGEEAPV